MPYSADSRSRWRAMAWFHDGAARSAARSRRIVSRGFVSALAGVAMTLLAWYGPWAWPAWPAFEVIDLVFGQAGFADLPFATRSAVVVVLIIVNVSSWGLVAYGGTWIVRRIVNPEER
jgi:hypothetical protein